MPVPFDNIRDLIVYTEDMNEVIELLFKAGIIKNTHPQAACGVTGRSRIYLRISSF